MTREDPSRDQLASARRLSLVALLIGDGDTEYEKRLFKSEDYVRRNVEHYQEAYDEEIKKGGGDGRRAADALRKKLARDVEALARAGVHVEVKSTRDGRHYRLKPGDYPPKNIHLEEEERAVLLGALRALRDGFPYSRPLGLALSNLIRDVRGDGAGSDLEPSVDAAGPDAAVARRLAKLDAAISRRKRVRFRYYAIGRDEISEREVEPYGLSLISGSWYVTGRDTTRDAAREFRLDRIEGKVNYAGPDREDQYEVPPGFETGPRAPWQLGPPVDDARIFFPDPDEADLALRTYPGALTAERKGPDGAVLVTPYSGGRQLASWLLSVGARALSPPPLVDAVTSALETLIRTHARAGGAGGTVASTATAIHKGTRKGRTSGSRTSGSRTSGSRTSGSRTSGKGVDPEPLALELALARYVAFMSEDEYVPLERVAGELGCTAEEAEEAFGSVKYVSDANRTFIDVELRDGELVKTMTGFDKDFRRSLWLSPVQVRAALLALDLVAGAADPTILEGLRRKVRAAVRKDDEADELDEVATETLAEEDAEIAAAVDEARREEKVLEIRYPSGPDDEVKTRTVEPMLVTNVRGRRYLNAYCRLVEDARLFRFDRILSARKLEERFTPRDDFVPRAGVEALDPRLYAAGRAVIRFSPEVARWMEAHHELDLTEKHEDGSMDYALSYKDPDWAAGRVMQYRGEAVVLEPGQLREQVRATAEGLLRAYREEER